MLTLPTIYIDCTDFMAGIGMKYDGILGKYSIFKRNKIYGKLYTYPYTSNTFFLENLTRRKIFLKHSLFVHIIVYRNVLL